MPPKPELIRPPLANFLELVIGNAGEVGGVLGTGNCLNWRSGESEHLLIARPSVHHSDTCLDVIKHRNAGYALNHVASAGCQLSDAIGDGAGHHVIVTDFPPGAPVNPVKGSVT